MSPQKRASQPRRAPQRSATARKTSSSATTRGRGRAQQSAAGDKPAKIGRPPKLTDERIERLIVNLKAGNYIEPSCRQAGISTSTFHNWSTRGKRERDRIIDADEAGEDATPLPDEAPYLDFLAAVDGAIAHAEIRAVTQVALAGEKDWRASMTMLERRHPERWGRKDRLETTGETIVTVVGAEELARKLITAEKAREPTPDPVAAKSKR